MSDENTVRAILFPDGSVMEELADGTLRPFETTTDWDRLGAMTEEEIEANAASSPDNPPWTDEELARMVRVEDVRLVRFRLNLTQEEFSRRFEIPLGTVRDWEQGKKRPDSAARALIKVIAYDPDTVTAALQRSPASPGAKVVSAGQ